MPKIAHDLNQELQQNPEGIREKFNENVLPYNPKKRNDFDIRAGFLAIN